MNRQTTPLIIFDCDGVLVESEVILIAAELEFLQRVGVTFERSAYIHRFLGMAPSEWKAQLSKTLATHLGRPVDTTFFDELDAYTRTRLEDQLVVVADAHTHIRQLPHQRCVASSSSPQGLAWKLQHTGLTDLFGDAVYSTHLVARGKPEPDLFLHAADDMGYQPADCLVVEDSVNGIKAAKKAGMTAIGFTAGGHCLAGHGATLESAGADALAGAYPELIETINTLTRQ